MSEGHSTGGRDGCESAGVPTPDTQPPASPGQGLGRVAIRGTAYMFAGQVLVKLTALVGLWVLGYYLDEEQFAVWGFALSTVALADCVRDMGAHKVLIQRGGEFDELGSPVFKMGFGFNLAAAVVLMGIAPVMARVYDDPRIAWLIVIAALTIPLQSPVTVMRAKLSIDLRFKTLVQLDIAMQFVKNGSMILLAILGFGVYSFVLPLVLMALFNIAAFRWCAGPFPPRHKLTKEHFQTIFSAVKWITLSSFFGALINQGDRLVIGWFEIKDVVGVYFFAFQLIFSTVVIFGSGMIGVFMPTLSKLADDPARRAQVYRRMLRVSAVVFSAVSIVALIVSGPAIHLLWQGRWDAAIPVAEVMSVSLSLYLLGPVAMSLIEASGRWHFRAALMCTEMVGVLIGAGVGAWLGGLVAIAVCVVSVKAVMGVVQCVVAGRFTGIGPGEVIGPLAGPVLLALASGSVCYFGSYWLLPGQAILAAAGGMVVFAALYAGGLRLLMPQHFQEMLGVAGQLVPGRRRAA